ncbi:recombinase family protein [Intestinimonas butyriciproducens]|nr:recombinase family protein [Intestinimonas butyriciproducens]
MWWKKRVYCLYRVSIKGQVEKDDIPMQKQYCREFAESQGWTIIKEFAEKGVSGFKVAAADRDAIQEIRQDAEERKFDILLPGAGLQPAHQQQLLLQPQRHPHSGG